MRVLFAAAEFASYISVGGLAEASGGLVRALRGAGVDVEVVLPDYTGVVLSDEASEVLDVPRWAAPARARSGGLAGVGKVTLVDVPGIARPHPYFDENGEGWPDNADRFFAFSAAVAALARRRAPDVLHLNDWHTGATLGLLDPAPPTVLTIHTLGYQGWTSGGWLDRIVRRSDLFEAYGGTNPLAGAIQLADRVIAVSPNYANEIRTAEGGSGLHVQLADLGDRLVGIRNGIDASVWDPASDRAIASTYAADDLAGKEACRVSLLDQVGWLDTTIPTVGMVSRLVDQKGVEFALEAARYAEGLPFRLVLLGSGEKWLADWASWLAGEHPGSVWFHDGFDADLAHRIFAGSDLLLMPSRFEPCGLAQMQAMQYGTIPVVSPVGGLVDTVVDADEHRSSGSGFVARTVDTPGVVDALHRAVRAWKHPRRRSGIQRRGMTRDWSWDAPARQHLEVYRSVAVDHRG